MILKEKVYLIRLYEKKSGRYYQFSVLEVSKPKARKTVLTYAEETIGDSCIIKNISKLPKGQKVIDYYAE